MLLVVVVVVVVVLCAELKGCSCKYTAATAGRAIAFSHAAAAAAVVATAAVVVVVVVVVAAAAAAVVVVVVALVRVAALRPGSLRFLPLTGLSSVSGAVVHFIWDFGVCRLHSPLPTDPPTHPPTCDSCVVWNGGENEAELLVCGPYLPRRGTSTHAKN